MEKEMVEPIKMNFYDACIELKHWLKFYIFKWKVR